MTDAVQSCVHERGWRLQSLMRTRRFHIDAELVLLYTAHVLSFIECITCAFTHASNSVSASLDRVQSSFLRSVGISDLDALHHFKFAPLCSRRDIANVGLIHRTLLGAGPACFKEFFQFDSSPVPLPRSSQAFPSRGRSLPCSGSRLCNSFHVGWRSYVQSPSRERC